MNRRAILGTYLLLAATLAAAKVTTRRRIEFLARPLSSISEEIAGFRMIESQSIPEAELRELRASSYVSRTYQKSNLTAGLFIAYYAQQRAGESMHSPKHCLPGSGWEIWNYATTIIPSQGRQIPVNHYSIRRNDVRNIVLYWYQSKDRIIASEYMGKFLLARDALFQKSTAASIVRIVAPDTPGALEAATDLAAGVIPAMQDCFGK